MTRRECQESHGFPGRSRTSNSNRTSHPLDILLMASPRAGKSRVICCQFPFRVFLPFLSRARLGFNESVMQEMHISFRHCHRALSLNKGTVFFFSQSEYNKELLCGFRWTFGSVFCFVLFLPFLFLFFLFLLLAFPMKVYCNDVSLSVISQISDLPAKNVVAEEINIYIPEKITDFLIMSGAFMLCSYGSLTVTNKKLLSKSNTWFDCKGLDPPVYCEVCRPIFYPWYLLTSLRWDTEKSLYYYLINESEQSFFIWVQTHTSIRRASPPNTSYQIWQEEALARMTGERTCIKKSWQ